MVFVYFNTYRQVDCLFKVMLSSDESLCVIFAVSRFFWHVLS